MNGTPRLRSAFPSTPSSAQKQNAHGASATGSWTSTSSPPDPKSLTNDDNTPLIPIRVLDAPSQRLYIAFFYLGLTVWRLYDYLWVLSDEADSLFLFMKWVGIDSVVLYGLPGLKIPWLQWSSSTMTLLFMSHAFLNAIMMLHIPIPLQSWMVAFTKLLYDRELAVLERNVKPASVLHNSSLILGKQIIHILPEGSAVLNPNQSSFCIGGSREAVSLPVRVNQTTPILVELLRIDLDANANETIAFKGKALDKIRKQADLEHGKSDLDSPRTLRIPITDAGLYRLLRAVDQSNLDVQRRFSDTLVVRCPSASIEAVALDKCKGDLTDFHIRVEGTPPMKIRYSRTVNGKDTSNHVLEYIHPEDLVSPLMRQRTSGSQLTPDSTSELDMSWARSQSMRVSINESLGQTGGYSYAIDEVQDACGNVVAFTSFDAEMPYRKKHGDAITFEQVLNVHERPRVTLQGCDAQHELKVEKGKALELPIRVTSIGSRPPSDSLHTITYLFTATNDIQTNQEHPPDVVERKAVIKPTGRGPQVSEPGLYSLRSISNEFCTGEVLEPSRCLLTNPPEPSLALGHEVIPGKCAGKPVGLIVDLDLTGTPPFRVFYTVSHDGGKVKPDVEEVYRIHSQLEFRPSVAGHYAYTFTQISDAIYQKPQAVSAQNNHFEQDIKPPASARFVDTYAHQKVCIEEPVSFNVEFVGDGPLVLEYELIHHRGRKKQQKRAVQGDGGETHSVTTERLEEGGEYTVTLLNIMDELGCRNPLSQEIRLDVSLQKPRVSFGYIEGKRRVMALEAKKVKLPIRLQGSSPWLLSYRNLEGKTQIIQSVLTNQNDELEVKRAGIYEITSIQDSSCPGIVDTAANQFEVALIPRPAIQLSESASIRLLDGIYVKKDVCEGDQDATELAFTGTPPFHVMYEQRVKPEHGSPSISSRPINAGLNSAVLKMETSKAGTHEYEFVKLGDYSYDHDPRKFSPVKVQQRVLANPSARFSNSGKTYKYCKDEDSGDEVIPISLTGVPPFQLEMEIRHHSASKAELVKIPHVEAKQYNFHIPHRVLALGTHAVTIRKVTDAHGCQRKLDFNAPHVQVTVADVPRISPLEAHTDYCVGERISYTLSGMPPFSIFYSFQGQDRKASVPTTNFRRLAEKPGEFRITGISDQRSTDACKAKVDISKTIHGMPSVRVSKGRTATAEIHEGSEAEILFEFGGTPPFEFIYTRSTNAPRGKKSEVIETKSEVSHEHVKTIRASDEGIYEVVSIKDKYCSFSTQKVQGKSGQKLLTYR